MVKQDFNGEFLPDDAAMSNWEDLVRKKGEERMACATCRRGGKPLSRLVNGRPRETVLRLIRSSLSTPGIIKKMRGPLAPINRPNRKMTPRSYSLKILMAEAARMNKKMINTKDEA